MSSRDPIGDLGRGIQSPFPSRERARACPESLEGVRVMPFSQGGAHSFPLPSSPYPATPTSFASAKNSLRAFSSSGLSGPI